MKSSFRKTLILLVPIFGLIAFISCITEKQVDGGGIDIGNPIKVAIAWKEEAAIKQDLSLSFYKDSSWALANKPDSLILEKGTRFFELDKDSLIYPFGIFAKSKEYIGYWDVKDSSQIPESLFMSVPVSIPLVLDTSISNFTNAYLAGIRSPFVSKVEGDTLLLNVPEKQNLDFQIENVLGISHGSGSDSIPVVKYDVIIKSDNKLHLGDIADAKNFSFDGLKNGSF